MRRRHIVRRKAQCFDNPSGFTSFTHLPLHKGGFWERHSFSACSSAFLYGISMPSVILPESFF